MSRGPKKWVGYSLIELVVVVVVLGILAAAVAPVIFTGIRAYDDVHGSVAVLDKQRYAIERIARELREVKYDPATGFAFKTAVGATTGHTVTFTRTFVETSGEESPDTIVTIGNTGTTVTLHYSVPKDLAAQVLTDELDGTSSLAFSYFQADGTTPASNTMDVRVVEISLSLSHNGAAYTQRTRVELKRRGAT